MMAEQAADKTIATSPPVRLVGQVKLPVSVRVCLRLMEEDGDDRHDDRQGDMLDGFPL